MECFKPFFFNLRRKRKKKEKKKKKPRLILQQTYMCKNDGNEMENKTKREKKDKFCFCKPQQKKARR